MKRIGGYAPLDLWRAEREILECCGVLYKRRGENWIAEGQIIAGDGVKGQLDVMHRKFLKSGYLETGKRS
jgi:hypothetical protein